jgi:hypothetical protein
MNATADLTMTATIDDFNLRCCGLRDAAASAALAATAKKEARGAVAPGGRRHRCRRCHGGLPLLLLLGGKVARKMPALPTQPGRRPLLSVGTLCLRRCPSSAHTDLSDRPCNHETQPLLMSS